MFSLCDGGLLTYWPPDTFKGFSNSEDFWVLQYVKSLIKVNLLQTNNFSDRFETAQHLGDKYHVKYHGCCFSIWSVTKLIV